jgi:thymidylate synthase (FAD)
MGKVIIQEETTKNPITLIGKEAGICYGADTENKEKNYIRGLDCLQSNHGRTLEMPSVYAVFEGYSARVIRELYTHIGGAPTRL